MEERKFCAKCGRKGDFEDNICLDCSEEQEPERKEKRVEVCRLCGRWRDGGRWRASPPEGELTWVTCPDCSKGPDYVEATIQLRSRYIESFWEEALDIAEKVVESERKRGVHVLVKVKDSDLEFSNKKAAERVAREIADRFGVSVKKTRKLVTYDHEKGRKIYRITLLVRLPQVKKGDDVVLDKQYTVKSVGRAVILEDENGEERTVSHKELENAKLR